MIAAFFESCWQSKTLLSYVLWPVSQLFIGASCLRRKVLQRFAKKINTPVVIVGNLSVGGNGKTPVVIALANALSAAGLKPGIISRGYGGLLSKVGALVTADSHAVDVGDEPVLIVKRTHCPMAIGRSRVAAVKALLSRHAVDIILSDDGLQHYRLARCLELVVVNGNTRFGNQLCLPAGPLREPLSRLQTVDYVLSDRPQADEWSFSLLTEGFFYVADNTVCDSKQLIKTPCVAVAGIASPERFFTSIASWDISFSKKIFADHHAFSANDFLPFDSQTMIIMTEKDAVKCQRFATKNMVYLKLSAQLTPLFQQHFLSRVGSILGRKK